MDIKLGQARTNSLPIFSSLAAVRHKSATATTLGLAGVSTPASSLLLLVLPHNNNVFS